MNNGGIFKKKITAPLLLVLLVYQVFVVVIFVDENVNLHCSTDFIWETVSKFYCLFLNLYLTCWVHWGSTIRSVTFKSKPHSTGLWVFCLLPRAQEAYETRPVYTGDRAVSTPRRFHLYDSRMWNKKKKSVMGGFSLTCVCINHHRRPCICVPAIWMLTCMRGPLCVQLCGGGVMAGAEVTVSPGHLMAVKEEEAGESSGNDHKAQVILHLQPILHG